MTKKEEPLQRYLNYEALKDKDPIPLRYVNIRYAFQELYPQVFKDRYLECQFDSSYGNNMTVVAMIKKKEPEKWKEAHQLFDLTDRNQRMWINKYRSKIPHRTAREPDHEHKISLNALRLKLSDPTEEGDFARNYFCREPYNTTMEQVRKSIEDVKNYSCSLSGVKCLSVVIPVGPLVCIFKCLTGEEDPKRKGSIIEFLSVS